MIGNNLNVYVINILLKRLTFMRNVCARGGLITPKYAVNNPKTYLIRPQSSIIRSVYRNQHFL